MVGVLSRASLFGLTWISHESQVVGSQSFIIMASHHIMNGHRFEGRYLVLIAYVVISASESRYWVDARKREHATTIRLELSHQDPFN